MPSRRLIITLTTGLLAFVVAVVVIVGSLLLVNGVRVSGLGWKQGPHVERLTWQHDGCVWLTLESVRLQTLRPLAMHADQAYLDDCDRFSSVDSALSVSRPAGLQRLPRLTLMIDSFALSRSTDEWPTFAERFPLSGWSLSLVRSQRTITAALHRNAATIDMLLNPRSGRWQLSATSLISQQHFSGDRWQFYGALNLDGLGQWGERLDGTLRVSSKDLIAAGHTVPDISTELDWQGPRWRLRATLESPWQVPVLGRLLPEEMITAQGQGTVLTQLGVILRSQGIYGNGILTVNSHRGNHGGEGALLFAGDDTRGNVTFQWLDGQIAINRGIVWSTPHTAVELMDDIELSPETSDDVHLRVLVDDLATVITSQAGQFGWAGPVPKWNGALAWHGASSDCVINGQWQGLLLPYAVDGSGSVAIQRDGKVLTYRLPEEKLTLDAWWQTLLSENETSQAFELNQMLSPKYACQHVMN